MKTSLTFDFECRKISNLKKLKGNFGKHSYLFFLEKMLLLDEEAFRVTENRVQELLQ